MNKTIQRITSAAISASILFTLPINVFAVSARNSFTVSLTQDSRVKYSGVSKSSFTIKSTAYKSVYAKVTNAKKSKYYVEDISVLPKNAADVTYNAKTGEIFIEHVRNDFRITPKVSEISYPADIAVDWQFEEGGVYDEENPAATVDFNVTVTDQNGKPAANTKVYYKSDKSEKSYTKVITTDKNGTAVVKHSYGLDEGEYEKSFTALFSTDKKFSADSITEDVDFNVVLQKKSDLQLTTDQVRASRTNEGDGGVIGVDSRYEYFTGVLHQAAITTDSGEWVTPENGNIDGLAPGQYALRWAERVEGNTIYLHSDYDYFTIDRAEWAVTAEETEGVTFKNDVLYATPGGEVFYYVDVENGYKITDYSVDKPNNIGEISYNAEDGYIYIGGITGSVKLNVTAEKFQTTAVKAKAARRVATTTETVQTATLLSSADVASEENEDAVSIADVYQAESDDEGKTIYVKLNVPNGVNSDISLKYKLSTARSYSTGKVIDSDNHIYSFSASPSTSAEKTYDVYVSYGENESNHVTVNFAKTPNINKNHFKATNEKGDRSNGTISYIGGENYNSFLYNKQGASQKTLVEGKTISGLDHGTWYVFVAPKNLGIGDDGSYNFRARSSSAAVSVGQDDDTQTYTVKFVNFAGETLSTTEYEENTSKDNITVPAKTKTYTDDDGNIHSYSWGTIENVTKNITYTEIETVQKFTTTEITDVSIDSDNYVNFTVKVTDKDGNPASGSVGISINKGSYSNYTLDSEGIATVKRTLSGDNKVSFKFYDTTAYATSESKEISVSVTKADKPTLEQTPDVNATGKGSITVTSDYTQLAYYKSGATTSTPVPEDNVITGLTGKNNDYDSATYYVYVIPQTVEGNSDYNFVTQSEKASIEVQNIVKTEYTLTVVYDNDNIQVFTKDYEKGTVLTAHAKTIDGKQFSHWTVGGKTVSTSKSYTFSLNNETTLNAVYVSETETVEETPVVVLSNNYRTEVDGKNKISFVSSRSVPDGFTVEKYGALYSKTEVENFTLDNTEIKYTTKNETTPNGSYTLTINVTNNINTTYYVRGYVTYKNSKTGEITTVYTEIASASYNALS